MSSGVNSSDSSNGIDPAFLELGWIALSSSTVGIAATAYNVYQGDYSRIPVDLIQSVGGATLMQLGTLFSSCLFYECGSEATKSLGDIGMTLAVTPIPAYVGSIASVWYSHFVL